MTRRFGGTGLGSQFARMAQLMGGRITVTSEVNQGTIFEFDLIFPLLNLKHKTLKVSSSTTGKPY